MTTARDLDVLADWFAGDFVQHWGGRPLAREHVARDCIGARHERLPNGARELVQCFLIEHDGSPIGYIQCWSELPDEGGLDIVLASQFQGRGLGLDAVRTLTRYVRDTLGWKRVTVDPAVGNARAIHAFGKCGFVFERDWPDHPDGPAVLMVFKNGG